MLGVSEPYTLAMLKETENIGVPGSLEKFEERWKSLYAEPSNLHALNIVAKDTLLWAYSIKNMPTDGLWDKKIPAHIDFFEKELAEKQKAASIAFAAREEAARKQAEKAAADLDADQASKDWIVDAEAKKRMVPSIYSIVKSWDTFTDAQKRKTQEFLDRQSRAYHIPNGVSRVIGPLFEAAVLKRMIELKNTS